MSIEDAERNYTQALMPSLAPGHGEVLGQGFANVWLVSLRDYFAAHAMSAILAKGMNNGRQWDNSEYSQVAGVSFQMADAMLAERAKPREAQK